jgi:hypothetical protein
MRQRVVEIARSYLGCKWPGPDGVFTSALLGTPSVRRWLASHPPHWCGVFHLHCLREAGMTDHLWHAGVGCSQYLPRLGRGEVPEPGDCAYFEHAQHHAVYVGLGASGKYLTIDGNSGSPWLSRSTSTVVLTERTTPPAAFYSIQRFLNE